MGRLTTECYVPGITFQFKENLLLCILQFVLVQKVCFRRTLRQTHLNSICAFMRTFYFFYWSGLWQFVKKYCLFRTFNDFSRAMKWVYLLQLPKIVPCFFLSVSSSCIEGHNLWLLDELWINLYLSIDREKTFLLQKKMYLNQ